MKMQEFDKRLKTALDGLEAPYEPGTWAALEQRLDAAAPPPPVSFDQTVGQALERLEAPYQPAHWEAMAQRLAQNRRLRYRLWGAKLAEAAVFLLLLAQLDGLLGPALHRQPVARPAGPIAETNASANRDSQLDAGAIQPGSSTRTTTRFENKTAGGTIDAANLHSPVDPLVDITNWLIPNEESAPLATDELLPAEVADRSFLPFDFLPGQAPTELINQPPAGLSPVVKRAVSPRRFYAGTYVSLQQQEILTGSDRRTAGGYGGGLLVGYRRGNWALETGVGYSRQRYQPKREIEIYAGNVTTGYYGSAIVGVDADVVNVPIKVTRRMFKLGRTSVQGVAGVNGHVALQKDYQYKTVFYPGSSPGSSPTLDSQPQLQAQGRGLLERGSLSRNAYVSVQAGVRIERTVGRRWTAFVEPTYNRAIAGEGIGPKKNRIHTLGVQAGVLASL